MSVGKSSSRKEKKDHFDLSLEQYKQHLQYLKENPRHLLEVLLHRDRIRSELKKFLAPKSSQANKLFELDKQFKKIMESIPIDEMEEWRNSINPGTIDWWWNYDKEPEPGIDRNLIWIMITSTLVIITTTFALEIIRRLWEGAPDNISVIGSLITIFITSSPLFKQGQQFAHFIFRRIKIIKSQYRPQAMAGMAFIAFVLILMVRTWGVQSLSLYYNNKGFSDLQDGNLTNAQHAFERATALSPDQAVPYQNLADIYFRIGLLENSIIWYQKAIEQDINFTPAYSGLGHLYNVQGEYTLAELILLAGLNINSDSKDKVLQSVTQYQLLSNLGWAYFEQGKNNLAILTLKKAVALESNLKEMGETDGAEYRTATPHFFLAQSYELLDQTTNAQFEWEESQRYLTPANIKYMEWNEIISSHLK